MKSVSQTWDVGCKKVPKNVPAYFCQTDKNSDAIRKQTKAMRDSGKQISRMSACGTHSLIKEKKNQNVKYAGIRRKTTNTSRSLTSKRRTFAVVPELCQIKPGLLLHLVCLLIRVLGAKSSPFDILCGWNWGSVIHRRSCTFLFSWSHCITCRLCRRNSRDQKLSQNIRKRLWRAKRMRLWRQLWGMNVSPRYSIIMETWETSEGLNFTFLSWKRLKYPGCSVQFLQAYEKSCRLSSWTNVYWVSTTCNAPVLGVRNPLMRKTATPYGQSGRQQKQNTMSQVLWRGDSQGPWVPISTALISGYETGRHFPG